MKRLLFSVFAIVIMAGYTFAQNEAYLDQVGGTYGSVTISQSNDGNKLDGQYGSVPGHTNGAAYMKGAINTLNLQQGGNDEVKLRMETSGNWNWGTFMQWGNGDLAVVDQKGTGDNYVNSMQSGKGTTELTQATDLGANTASIYQKGALTDATKNLVKINQTAEAGNNEITTSAFSDKYEGDSWEHTGIVQWGESNLIKGVSGNVATQTSTVGGNNHFSALQYGNSNTVSLTQSASGSNSADFYQHGNNQNLSVYQVGSISNTAIISQAY